MAVDWNAVATDPTNEKVVIITGVDNSFTPPQLFFHVLHLAAFEWRSVEYGIDPENLDDLFKVLFSEILDIWTPEVNSDDAPNPWDEAPEKSLPKKMAFVERVSAVHGAKLKAQKVTPAVDRVELGNRVKKYLGKNGIKGVGLEKKKLHAAQARGKQDSASQAAVKAAMSLMDMGAVNNAEAALIGGAALVEEENKIDRRRQAIEKHLSIELRPV